LRNNYVVEELVEAFKSARPHIMEYANKREEPILSASSKRKRGTAEIEEQSSSPVRKRTRSARRAQQSSQQSSQQVMILDSEGNDEDYMPGTSVTNPLSIYS
jgi:E3 ubiquitin-protein ligase RAD18